MINNKFYFDLFNLIFFIEVYYFFILKGYEEYKGDFRGFGEIDLILYWDL
jgi:hypothetical protein